MPPHPFIIATVLLLISGIVAAALPHASRSHRLCVAVTPTAVMLALWIAVSAAPGAVHSNWDALRLSFAFVVSKGHALYQPAIPGGAILPSIYPPGIAWAYLPVTGLNTPTHALVAGRIWTATMVLGSLFLLLLRAGRGVAHALLLTAVAFFLVQISPPLREATIRIHADAPALAFATLSILFMPARPAKNIGLVAMAGFCAAMAAWSKQTFLPALPAIAIFGLLRGGKRGLMATLLSGLGWYLLILMMLSIGYGFKTLWFNLVTIPGNHSWIGSFYEPTWRGTYTREFIDWIEKGERDGRFRILVDSLRNTMETCWPLLAGGIAAAALPVLSLNSIRSVGRETIHHIPQLAFIFAVFLLPASVLGPVKVGGASNTIAPAPWFALVTIVTTLAVYGERPDSAGRNARITMAGLAVWGLIHFMPFPRDVAKFQQDVSRMNINIHQLGYDYAKENPGRAWFSWCPLPELMATGELHHVTTGLTERWSAGYGLTRDQVEAFVPPDFEVIAANDEDWILGEYFPDYVRLPDSVPPFAYKVYGRR